MKRYRLCDGVADRIKCAADSSCNSNGARLNGAEQKAGTENTNANQPQQRQINRQFDEGKPFFFWRRRGMF